MSTIRTDKLTVEPINQKFDPFTELSHAIVLQAVNDYQQARKQVKNPNISTKARNIAEAVLIDSEEFFASSWFNVLTDLDGEDLWNRLQDLPY